MTTPDALGTRMKEAYEARTQTLLPRRTNTIIRLDGKAFHTFTRNFKKPFDDTLVQAMNDTAIALCDKVQGCKCAYVQSDEITLLVTDYTTIATQAWFDGNVQKITSISASIASNAFNQSLLSQWVQQNNMEQVKAFINQYDFASFDSRVFVIPDPHEVVNCFLWRQKDCIRNSVQMVGQSIFSHKQLHGVKVPELIEKLKNEADVDWNVDFTSHMKYGRLITYNESQKWHVMDITPQFNDWRSEMISLMSTIVE